MGIPQPSLHPGVCQGRVEQQEQRALAVVDDGVQRGQRLLGAE